MPITLATHAMGTRFELVLAGGDTERLRPAGEAALREIDECHRRYNLFDPGSWLNSINRRAADEAVALDEVTFELLRTCVEVYTASGGAFDVTVAPLMRAWGFHGSDGPAGRDVIDEAKRYVGMDHVLLDRASKSVRFARQGVALDLGGVAKGFAIDQAIGVLRECGVGCALLHGGTSTIAAIGAPPGEPGWRVSLRTGGDGASDRPLPVVCLKDETLSVSAPHGRTIESDTMTLGHVLDPRTGKPAACGAYAAAVGASACQTDAWSTALLVLGEAPKAMPDTIRAMLPDTAINVDTLNRSSSMHLEASYR
jgi:FAD:protein FMN transferase